LSREVLKHCGGVLKLQLASHEANFSKRVVRNTGTLLLGVNVVEAGLSSDERKHNRAGK
jgi:hypothetical protein